MSSGIPRMRLRKKAFGKGNQQKADITFRKGAFRKLKIKECEAQNSRKTLVGKESYNGRDKENV